MQSYTIAVEVAEQSHIAVDTTPIVKAGATWVEVYSMFQRRFVILKEYDEQEQRAVLQMLDPEFKNQQEVTRETRRTYVADVQRFLDYLVAEGFVAPVNWPTA